MTANFTYEFDHETLILYKFYFGPIALEDIELSWLYAFENKMIPKETKGFILDYRKASFKIQIKDHVKIANFFREHLDVFGGLKIAIITEEPKDVVIPVMLKTKDDGYSSKPFCTREAAVKWVLS
jgi:hypothetical protein